MGLARERVVALAGNPNVGKSTVFNALTGLRQHTGNWPGKTVVTAQGRCTHRDRDYVLVDLPGTYSLMAHSPEEETARVGPMLEGCPQLGERRNIEFLTVEDRERLTVRVWERGSGVTLACGTGACASFAAARRRDLCGRKVQVRLPGGVLQVEEREGRLLMTGPARTVFRGEIDLPWPPGPGEKR